jgi:Ca-activated chloride channel homolog
MTIIRLLMVLLTMSAVFSAENVVVVNEGLFTDVTRGALRVVKPDGAVVECPLKHSAYAVEIAGPVAQVTLVQTFTNPFPEPIEAVYVFPLSHESGVNSLEMEVGDRRIVGALLRRDDAKAVYEQAKSTGRTASLLDQERPNIFTQSISNLPPGGEVRIRISYVERLTYDRGAYEFHLPLVVGPRFIPGSPTSGVVALDPAVAKVAVPLEVRIGDGAPKGTGRQPDTNEVSDASRITPPVLQPGTKSPFDVSIAVRIAAGMAIRDVRSVHHRVQLVRPDASTAAITLDPNDAIPNKDFVVRYAVDGERPAVGVVTHRADDGGYLLLTLQPGQLDQQLEKRVPRDLCFLVDVSGSMRGAPLAKVKEAMQKFLALAGPQDRLQVVTFAGSAHTCFPTYLMATPENIRSALVEVDRMNGGGGTRMMAGITAVLDEPLDPVRQRVVVMLTDGYIGNEKEIIAEVGRRLSDRLHFWCLGVGSSVNRFLIDGVAEVGGGMGKVLGLDEDALPVVSDMMSRIQRSQLDEVEVDWGGLQVSDVVPGKITSLWSGQPVQICARCAVDQLRTATVTVRGRSEGAAVAIPVTVSLAQAPVGTAAVRSIWARQHSAGLQRQLSGNHDEKMVEEITALCLRYSLMSPYTSFVAVDERIISPGGTGRRIDVAVPLPEGVSIEALPVLNREELKAHAPELLADSSVELNAVSESETGSTGAFMAIGAGGGSAGMFSSRSGGGKRRALAAGGGTKKSESATDAALRFLRRHQGVDGSWHPVTYVDVCTEAPKCEPGAGGMDDQVALTAQALLGFLGAGYDHKTPNKYRDQVARALTFLRGRQQTDGALATTIEAHALALTALAEGYAMTNDPDLKPVADRAIVWLLGRRVAGVDGKPLAWGDEAGVSTTLTFSAIFALKSSLAAGLDIADGMQRAKVWAELVWKAANPAWATLERTQASRFPARWTTTGKVDGEDNAAGALALVFVGRHAGDVALESLLNRIKETAPPPADIMRDPRLLHLATLAGFQVGGDWWTWWDKTYRAGVPAAQRAGDGCFDGSWDPPALLTRGRLQSTVLILLSLEVYYAYRQP